MKDTKSWIYKIIAAVVPILLEWLASLLGNPGSGEEKQGQEAEKPRSGIVGT